MTTQEIIDNLRAAAETLDGLKADLELDGQFEPAIDVVLKTLAKIIDALRGIEGGKL